MLPAITVSSGVSAVPSLPGFEKSLAIVSVTFSTICTSSLSVTGVVTSSLSTLAVLFTS